jgi:hypothetical protein
MLKQMRQNINASVVADKTRNNDMKTSIVVIVGVAIITVIMSSLASSKIIEFPLSEMVSNSEIIVVGTVVHTEKTKDTVKFDGNEYEQYKATIHIENMIKGNGALKEVDVYYLPSFVSLEATFAVGDRAIYFIKTSEGRTILVQGYGGKAKIEKDVVETRFIRGEPDTQNFGIFLQKIMKLIQPSVQ